MKELWKWPAVLLLMAGCRAQGFTGLSGEARLTPYVPVQSSETAPAPTLTPAASPIPQATPTPFLHTVALRETISDIALRYGVSMDAIMAANPDVDPNAMVVGMQLVIPGVQSSAGVGLQQAASLQVSDPSCLPSSRGGWWCTSWVENDQASDVCSISVTFSLADASGNLIAAFNAPALLNCLKPSGRIPASAYFSPPIQPGSRVAAILQSAVAVDASAARFLPAEVRRGQVTITNRMAQVNGSVILPAGSSSQIRLIWVAALAYDEGDTLVGARRIEITPTASESGETSFSIHVYSTNAKIERVDVLAEAHIK